VRRFVLALILFGPILLAQSLHVAVRAGDLDKVRELLAAGHKVNDRDPLGGTPLHDAAWGGHADIALLLLDAGAEVDAPHQDINAAHAESGSTPLHYAILTNRLAMVKLLASRGADLKRRHRMSSTALHLAASRGHREIVEFLLANQAEVDAEDASGATPLDEAAWKGNTSIVELLLKAGANPRHQIRDTRVTPLHEAAARGHLDSVRLLVVAGADIDAKDSHGLTALEEALQQRHTPVVDYLMGKGAKFAGGDPKAILKQMEDAVMKGQADVVKLLIDRGVDPDSHTPSGSTLIHDAGLKGHVAVAEVLLAAGASPNALNQTGATPLHDAALAGQLAMAQLLLSRGADVNALDREFSATPLHYAASWGREAMVELLLDKGADPTRRNKSGKTAADLAADGGHSDIAKRLRQPSSVPGR
jgi:cytohesin